MRRDTIRFNEKRLSIKNDRFSIILNFFENKQFRYKVKRSHRERYWKKFYQVYNIYRHFKERNWLGKQFEGGGKAVFELHNTNLVLKIYKTKYEYDEEYKNFHFLKENGLGALVPRGHFFDRFSLFEKADTSNSYPAIFKKVHKDLSLINFGKINDSPVILDITSIDREKILEQKNFLLSILPKPKNDFDWKYISSYLELDKIKDL